MPNIISAHYKLNGTKISKAIINQLVEINIPIADNLFYVKLVTDYSKKFAAF